MYDMIHVYGMEQLEGRPQVYEGVGLARMSMGTYRYPLLEEELSSFKIEF